MFSVFRCVFFLCFVWLWCCVFINPIAEPFLFILFSLSLSGFFLLCDLSFATFYVILVCILVLFYAKLALILALDSIKPIFLLCCLSTVLLNIFRLLFGCWCYVHVIIMLHYFFFLYTERQKKNSRECLLDFSFDSLRVQARTHAPVHFLTCRSIGIVCI